MNDSKIAVRYAKAFFELALEKNKLDATYKDVELILNTLEPAEDLKDVIKSPIISPANKNEILLAVFGSKVDEITKNFIALICENNREAFLDRILMRFEENYRKHKGITEAIITTAFKLDDNSKAKIVGILKSQLKGEIELKEQINDEIIGGFILSFDNTQLDVSVNSELQKVKRELLLSK